MPTRGGGNYRNVGKLTLIALESETEGRKRQHHAGTQVSGTGHTRAHCGRSKCPSHSVHFFGLMT